MSRRGTTGEQGNLPSKWTLVRDILSFLGGWYLTFQEVARPEVREAVLILAGSLISVPVAIQGGNSVVEAVANRRAGTVGSQPDSPPSDSSSSS